MKPPVKTLKIDDVRQLQALVADHAEALQRGLKVLDTGVLLGGATIDVLALDAEQSLVLVTLAFVADDDMLVRGLEGYSWCLEYPDRLRRLYPMARLGADDPPALLFIAERLPDAFLRKIKHLRLPRAACLEFRFGLQFSTVSGPRGTDERPEPPEAIAESRRTPAEPLIDPRLGVLEGLHLPDHDPPPSVEWQRVVAPTPGEPDERRVNVVRDYLQREFPTAVIYDFYDHDRAARVFHLQDSQGSVVHTAAVAGELLEEHTERELRAYLERHKVARVLRQAGQAAVSVTRTGLRIERR